MLRVLDGRTGSYAEIRPGRPGLLRVRAHGPQATGLSGVSALRLLLAADLLARTAELSGLQVLTVLALGGKSPGQTAALDRDADALGIHPPAAHVGPDEARAPADGPFDVHVISEAATFDDGQGGLVMRVGAARMRGPDTANAAAAEESAAEHGQDPLAVRLALMSFPFNQFADLTADVLAGARETLGRWRHRVAEWAESPSKPIPPHIAEMTRAAFDHLDTVSVLAQLRGLAAEASVPPGAKFETFVYADRILGLELAREIGHLPG